MKNDKKSSLVLGASTKTKRYSNVAIKRLVGNGHPVSAIGLRSGVVEGVEISTGKPDLKDIHTVTLYINSKRQPEYYDYLIALKPERVIFNPGTENPEFYEKLKENNINVKVGCTLVLLSAEDY